MGGERRADETFFRSGLRPLSEVSVAPGKGRFPLVGDRPRRSGPPRSGSPGSPGSWFVPLVIHEAPHDPLRPRPSLCSWSCPNPPEVLSLLLPPGMSERPSPVGSSLSQTDLQPHPLPPRPTSTLTGSPLDRVRPALNDLSGSVCYVPSPLRRRSVQPGAVRERHLHPPSSPRPP